nr:hypothetical protein [Tanacetum cinerariifolium]
MTNNNNNNNSLPLRSVLENDRLTGPNFRELERNLQIIFLHEQKWYVLENPIGLALAANATVTVRNAYQRHVSDLLNVDVNASYHARTERFDAIVNLSNFKMAEGSSVSVHVIKMIGHISRLKRLAYVIVPKLIIDFFLNYLSNEYKPFILNYNVNNVEGGTIAELHNMLKTNERGIEQKSKDVLVVANGNYDKNGEELWTEVVVAIDED